MAAFNFHDWRMRWDGSGFQRALITVLALAALSGLAWVIFEPGRAVGQSPGHQFEIGEIPKHVIDVSELRAQQKMHNPVSGTNDVPDPGAVAVTNRLLPMVEAADSKATSSLVQLVNTCDGFNRSRARYANASPGGEPKQLRLQNEARKRLQAMCSDPRLHDREVLGLVEATQAELAASGDDLSSVERLGRDGWGKSRNAKVKEIWDLAANSDEREVRLAAIDAVIERGLAEKYEAPFNIDDKPWNPKIGSYRAAAAAVVACEIEGVCGPFTLFQEQRCIENGECASDLDVRTFVRTVAFSDSERDPLLHYIDAITEQLKSSKAQRGR